MTTRQDYSNLASGFVLESAPGFPAFPVRLAQEMFLRAATHLGRTPLRLWDPCCGSGYLATVLGLLNRDRLREVICSDTSTDATTLATRNMRLLTLDGLADRARLLRQRAHEFDKSSYADAAEAADRLAAQLRASGGDLPTQVRRANALTPAELTAVLPSPTPDLVIADVPYGSQTEWADPDPHHASEPLTRLTTALAAVLAEDAVVAVCAQRRKISIPHLTKAIDRFRVGTRSVVIARAGDLRTEPAVRGESSRVL